MKTAFLSLLLSLSAHADWPLAQMVTTSGDQTTYHPKAVPPSLINPWPAELEADFQKRAHAIVQSIASVTKPKVNTYFENEKKPTATSWPRKRSTAP